MQRGAKPGRTGSDRSAYIVLHCAVQKGTAQGLATNLEGIAMAETIFSKIISREIPATIEYEDDDVLAFRDISPQAPVHVIVIPKRHIATVNDIAESDAELIGRMVLAAQRVARDMGVDQSGYRLVMNCNSDGGQSVFHIHIHLLGGRAMNWPPG